MTSKLSLIGETACLARHAFTQCKKDGGGHASIGTLRITCPVLVARGRSGALDQCDTADDRCETTEIAHPDRFAQ
jgi:hypothetical protein